MNGMELYEPRRCTDRWKKKKKKTGHRTFLLSFFYPLLRCTACPFSRSPGPSFSIPESVRADSFFFFAPLLYPKIFVSDSRRFFSVDLLSFLDQTAALFLRADALLIFNWNQRSVQILDPGEQLGAWELSVRFGWFRQFFYSDPRVRRVEPMCVDKRAGENGNFKSYGLRFRGTHTPDIFYTCVLPPCMIYCEIYIVKNTREGEKLRQNWHKIIFPKRIS